MLCSLPRSCLLWCTQSIVLTVKGGYQLWPGDILNCVSCFFGEKACSIYVKSRNFRVSCSPGSAEALVGCGGKIKYILIVYFLGNICAKNCRNRTAYVKIIASCKGGTFFETRCTVSRLYVHLAWPLLVDWMSMNERNATPIIIRTYLTASVYTRCYWRQDASSRRHNRRQLAVVMRGSIHSLNVSLNAWFR